jgi:hypothetical protein
LDRAGSADEEGTPVSERTNVTASRPVTFDDGPAERSEGTGVTALGEASTERSEGVR